MDALTSLGKACIHKSSKDLFLEYLSKLGQGKRIQIMSEQRFWPIKPKPGEQLVFRRAQSWQEAAILARDMCLERGRCSWGARAHQEADQSRALSPEASAKEVAQGASSHPDWRSQRRWDVQGLSLCWPPCCPLSTEGCGQER